MLIVLGRHLTRSSVLCLSAFSGRIKSGRVCLSLVDSFCSVLCMPYRRTTVWNAILPPGHLIHGVIKHSCSVCVCACLSVGCFCCGLFCCRNLICCLFSFAFFLSTFPLPSACLPLPPTPPAPASVCLPPPPPPPFSLKKCKIRVVTATHVLELLLNPRAL